MIALDVKKKVDLKGPTSNFGYIIIRDSIYEERFHLSTFS